MNLLLLLLASFSMNGESDYSFETFTPEATKMLLSPVTDANGVWVEPGILPEGDYLYDLTYTADGENILVANYVSENVSVINHQSGAVTVDIPTDGFNPGSVAAASDYFVITFPFQDKALITDSSGNPLGTVVTGEQPWKTKFSPDGETAYIACDVDDCVSVVDLSTQTVTATISNFTFWLQGWGFGSETPRIFLKFSNFEVTNDGQYLATTNGDEVQFFSTATGSLHHSIPVSDCVAVGLSGDGSHLIAVSSSSFLEVHRIDLSTSSVGFSVSVPGSTIGSTADIAANQTGTKVFLSTSDNSSTLINFTTQTWKQFTSTYSPHWLDANYDHTLAVSGLSKLCILNFETEEISAQYNGESQWFGGVSPVSNRSAGINPLSSEDILLYSFTATQLTFDGMTKVGSEIEADAPRRISVSPDGNWAAISNTMSDNCSLIDLSVNETVAVLEMGDRVQDVQFTPDSRYAVVCTFKANSVKVIDTQSASVVAEVPTGSRPNTLDINPEGTLACVANISDNSISFVVLNGADSYEAAEVPCGTIGVSWAAWGVESQVILSPDGSLLLVCDSFNDNVRLFNTGTYTEVACIPVAEFPLRAAFNSDGTRAMVTCYSADKVALLNIEGASSSVIGTWDCGDGPLRIAYDQVNDRFGVGLYSDGKVMLYDGQLGMLQDVEQYPGNVYQPMFTESGDLMALVGSGTSTPARLYRDGTPYDLPAKGCTFDFCDNTNTAVIAIPGPDIAYAIQYESQGIEGVQGSAVSLGSCVSVSPNPSAGSASFSFSLPSAALGTLAVYDIAGRKVAELASGEFTEGENQFTSELESLSPGVYAVRFTSAAESITGRFAVVD